MKIPFSATNWKGHAARPRALFLLLPVAVLPSFLGEIHFAKLENSMLCSRTPQRRELDYLRLLGASLQSAASKALAFRRAGLTFLVGSFARSRSLIENIRSGFGSIS